MANSYLLDLRRKELLEHFEKRFADELKKARADCDYVNVFPSIKEGKDGKLVATVKLAWVRDGRHGEVSALYEYLNRSPSQQVAGWYCSHDWND